MNPFKTCLFSIVFQSRVFIAVMNNNICKDSLIHLSKMLLKLKNSNCLNECFINKPLETTKIFMQNNNIYWGSQFDKMPIMFFDKEETDFIDGTILSHIVL